MEKIMEIYIKGKYEKGVGSAAYVVVCEDELVAQGSKRLGESFEIGDKVFPCDQFNTEILAAICGVARCSDSKAVNIYSNNKSVIKWLMRGEEPEGRTPLLDIYRRKVADKSAFVDYIPYFERDDSGNKWNKLCEQIAREAL